MSEFSMDSLQDLGLAPATPATTGPSQDLGQEDFLMLMTAQLANQDPFNPQDNEDFIAQMAQFSTVSGIETLTNSFAVLSQTLAQGQALQAAGLVGHEVLVPTEFSELSEGGTIAGAVDLESAAQSVTIDVIDANGATVDQVILEAPPAGLYDFEWDGTLEDGTPAPAGVYEFRATATGANGSVATEMYLDAEVESVTVTEEGTLVLDVAGIGMVDFDDIRRID